MIEDYWIEYGTWMWELWNQQGLGYMETRPSKLAEYNLPVRGVDDYVRRHFPSARPI